jgi:MFS family permease
LFVAHELKFYQTDRNYANVLNQHKLYTIGKRESWMRFTVRLGTFLGNVLHHYDSSLFGWVAPFLAPLLFPDRQGAEALLLTFALLPLNYLAKPLGAFIWGYLGDRFGRKPVLVMTLTGMAISTCSIGFLPLVPDAWIFLALCRILQGFFSAGEKTGAALFLLEHTPPHKRALTSALYDATGIVGIFTASMLASFCGETHWRLLFFLGAGAGLSAVFLRKGAEESPEYSPSKITWKALWAGRLELIRISIVSGFSYANYYLLSIFMNGFLPQITSITKQEMLAFNTHLLWIDSLLLLGFGYVCRWIKKEHLMASATLFAAFFAIPLFMQLEGASWGQAAAVRLALVVFGVALAAPYHAWKMELLATHRFLIGGVGAALGAKIFGAPMPLLSTWLVTKTGFVWTAALPIVVLGAASSVVILWGARKRVPIVNSP